MISGGLSARLATFKVHTVLPAGFKTAPTRLAGSGDPNLAVVLQAETTIRPPGVGGGECNDKANQP